MTEIHVQSGGSLELYPEGERVAKADERYTVRGLFCLRNGSLHATPETEYMLLNMGALWCGSYRKSSDGLVIVRAG